MKRRDIFVDLSISLQKKIIRYDRNYEQIVIIQKNEMNVYVVCYDNCHLTKNHLKTQKKFKSKF